MSVRIAFRRVNPFAGIAGMVFAGLLLVVAIFFTWLDLPWIAFLSGVLSAAVVGLLNRLTYAEEELESLRETQRYLDDEMPVMIAYVSADGLVASHNKAFRHWLRARRETINGRAFADVVGATTYSQMKPALMAALAGEQGQEFRAHALRDGRELRFHTYYLPHVDAQGAVKGAHVVQTDVTSQDQEDPTRSVSQGTSERTAPVGGPEGSAQRDDSGRLIFVDTMREELTDWGRGAERLREALDQDEFCLFGQAIRPVVAKPEATPFLEVLLRLREEEEGLMPPGAFLPLAEEYGLLPELDRWVVRHLLEWICARPERQAGLYSVNLSAATMAQSDFADFVVQALAARKLRAPVLCFELQESDVLAALREAAELVRHLSAAGCRTMLCGFGTCAGSFGLLEHLRVDMLKIDGGIVLGLPREPMARVKLKAIARIARKTGRATVAEFVESDETLVALREEGVDYAQGFGISRPAPLEVSDDGPSTP